jgi:MFS family permease
MGQQMQFLELMPQYKCANNPKFVGEYDCMPLPKKGKTLATFCGKDNIYHRIDYSNPLSIHNWIVDLKPDLTCIEQGFTSPIGLMGSMQFVGWTISAFITPRLADIHGRKPIFLLSMAIQLAALIGIYISRNVTLTIAMIFVFGTGGVGRSSISYLYMQEFLPKDKQTLVGTILQLNNGFVAIYTVIYYWFISNYWIPIQVFGGVLTVVSAIGVWFLPESPKYLLTVKRYDAARAAISHIAKVNGKAPFTNLFDREVLDKKHTESLNASYLSPGGGDNKQLLTQGTSKDGGNMI